MATRRKRDSSKRWLAQNGHAVDDPNADIDLRTRVAELEAAQAEAELRKLELHELSEAAQAEAEVKKRELLAARRQEERSRAQQGLLQAETPGATGKDSWAQLDAERGALGPNASSPEEHEPASDTSPQASERVVHSDAQRRGTAESGSPGLLVLWHRKSTVMLLTLLLGCAFGGVYLLLPERYDSSVRLEARSSGKQSSFEFLQASQILARTYSEVARSGVIADLVARRLPFARTKSSVLDSVSVVTVSDTPLIKVTATQEKGSQARTLANVYANTLLRYVDRQARAQEGSLSLVHAAESPTRAGPGLWMMVALGSLLGLLLGIAIAFFQERLEPFKNGKE